MSEIDEQATGAHRAGAFDVRNFIGALIGIFGVILVITSFFQGQGEIDKADGLHVNLWTGIAMIVAAAIFLTWARVKPVIVPDDPASLGEPDADGLGSGS